MRTIGVDAPAYLLGATVADPADCEAFRGRLAPLRTTEKKLHWRNLDRRHRAQAIDVIAQLDLHHVVVVAVPMNSRKQERSRARCLERLVWELGQLGISELTLEARPASLMKKDRQLIDALRGRGALPASLRVEHGLPSADPMLWIPDQILGAVGASLEGDSSWLERIRPMTQIIPIRL